MTVKHLMSLFAASAATLTLTACPGPVGMNDAGQPVYELLTGSLYVQGGSTTALKFNTTAEPTNGVYSGGITIGAGDSTGTFELSGSAGNFTMSGSTRKCTSWQSSGYCYDSTYWKQGLSFGLSATASGIWGSSPMQGMALVWNISKRAEVDGSISYSGTIDSMSGSITVGMVALKDGTLSGRMNFSDASVILSGYIDPQSVAMVPADAATILLVTSALHKQLVR